MKLRSMLAVSMAGVALLAACGGSGESEDSPPAEPTPQSQLELTSLEQDYLFQISAAWDLFGTKAASFRAVFAQAWPTRERLFTALYDAGAGTAWVDSLEATEKLEPPRRFQDDHEVLLVGLAELARNDAEIGETLKDGDLVEFAVLNSEGGIAIGLLFSELSPRACQSLTEEENSCRSEEPLPGADYGLKLELIMLRFEAQFGPRLGALPGPFATEAEIIAVLDQTFSPLVSVTEATLEELSQLEPPEGLLTDHEILVQYVADQRSRVLDALELTPAGDREGLAVFELIKGRCETTELLSADALTIARGHFSVGDIPCTEILS